MNELGEVIQRIPRRPKGVIARYDQESGVLHLRMASVPFGVKVVAVLLWLLTSCVVLSISEGQFKLLSKFVLWIHATTTMPAGLRLGIYIFEFALCVLLLGIFFVLVCRTFKITVEMSPSFIVVSGLRTRRWDLTGAESVHFKATCPRERVTDTKGIDIEEWGITRAERMWLNDVLREVMRIRDELT